MIVRTLLLTSLLAALACEEEAPAEPQAPAEPVEEAPPEPEPELPEADPNEACARVVVVAYEGAAHAADSITRTQEEARERAEALLARVDQGESIANVAREASDASSSGPRGGLLGTYERDEWPAAHDVLKEPVFALALGARTPVLEAPYGYAFAERCAVQKVHTRHILVRYAGARNAPDDVERTREAARELATTLRASATAEGADFAALARERSEDSSAERGGDLGAVGRGRLMPAYEAAAFALQPGAISDVVETPFGFHVIQRMPDES
ncbi:MAG: peptidylprolyl isomerase [Myxococcota bacterium]